MRAVGAALRRQRARHRTSRRTLLAALAVGLPLAITTILPPTPRLIWNVSASAPLGPYWIGSDSPPVRGQWIAVRVPARAETLATTRRYIATGVPLLKRVAGVRNDEVCAADRQIFINGRLAATRRRVDGAGRPLPWWTGCRRLGPDEIFLLNPDAPASFDGRYFGITPRRDMIGRASPLWR